MSVQPTSEKRTALQLSGSAAKAAPEDRIAVTAERGGKGFCVKHQVSPIRYVAAAELRVFVSALFRQPNTILVPI